MFSATTRQKLSREIGFFSRSHSPLGNFETVLTCHSTAGHKVMSGDGDAQYPDELFEILGDELRTVVRYVLSDMFRTVPLKPSFSSFG